MRTLTLSWYTMPGGFRQCTVGRATLSQRDYRHIVRLAAQRAEYDGHNEDGYAVTTTVPATPEIRAYIRSRRMGKRQRVQYFDYLAAKDAYEATVVEAAENTTPGAKRRMGFTF